MKEIEFIISIFRNASILAGLMLVSAWATKSLNWELCKPAVVFFITYILTELGNYYGILPKNKKGETLLFNNF